MSLVAQPCYHCDLPVPAGTDFPVEIDGQSRAMCCVGCQAVASAIVNGGLSQFYQYRSEKASTPESLEGSSWAVYDLPDVQQDFVVIADPSSSSNHVQAQLLIGGITCAACVWLIEKHLLRLPQVEKVRVNASTHRCWVELNTDNGLISEVFESLDGIGFKPQAATDENQNKLLDSENRQALRRLGIAGLGMMQVGMVAIALYGGELLGISEQWQGFLRIVSWLFATPVVFYSAVPFYKASYRALKVRHLVMDVPVSIAILLAYFASCWATLNSGPDVYFDSVSMFTFLLLLGRYLEMRARHRAGFAAGNLGRMIPPTAHKVVWSDPKAGEDASFITAGAAHEVETVPVKSLSANDVVLVMSGETIVCDGVVVAGQSQVDESLLTGESVAVPKQLDSLVAAGTFNGESPLWVKITAIGSQTRLSSISRLVAQAEQEKPAQVALADKLAAYFVAAVLVIAVSVFWYWWQHKPEDALWIALSVLVVTCPCALSLATPVALTAATNTLRRQGLLVSRGHVVELLTRLNRVIFDKTGTLTEGLPSVENVQILAGDYNQTQLLEIAAALESGNSHPIAKAFKPFLGAIRLTELRSFTAQGVEGVYNGEKFKLGKIEFVSAAADSLKESLNSSVQSALSAFDEQQGLFLSQEGRVLAFISLADPLRKNAKLAVAQLQAKNLQVELLSGDRPATVCHIANVLGIEHASASVSPEQKLAKMQQHQAGSERVMMVGDGINDVPVLSGADLSVAMPGAADIAQTHADCLLLSGDLRVIPLAIDTAHKARKIIRQNISWAVGYNLLALPLAAIGWVPPYVAAIGMSLSSLVVVLNALRLNHSAVQTPTA